MVFKESSNGDLDQLMAYWGDRCQKKSDVAFVYDVLMTGRIIQQLADIYCTNVFNKGVCFHFPGIKCCPGEKNTIILWITKYRMKIFNAAQKYILNSVYALHMA